MKIYLIRHGETKGNRERRYVGRTDEGLLPEGIQALKEKKMPQVERVYASPLRRCRQTAQILFPKQEPVLIEDLRECDFGEFEYKNYAELNGNLDYQRFIDTMGGSGFPGGESMKNFQERCVRGFYEVMRREAARQEEPKPDGLRQEEPKPDEPGQEEQRRQTRAEEGADIAFVVHGGTIMAILDRFADPHRDYYEWQAKNGCGYAATVSWKADGELSLTDVRELAVSARAAGGGEFSDAGFLGV